MMLSSKANHLSDNKILLFIDGEMPASEAVAAHRHLSGCPACRARQMRMERSLAEMDPLLNPAFEGLLPAATAARVQLRAQLQQASKPESQSWRKRLEIVLHRQPRGLFYAELAAIMLAVCFLSWRGIVSTRQLDGSRYTAMLEPNHMLTPGATRPVSLADICPLGDDDLDPDVAPQKREAVFQAYGIAHNASGKDYQVDYLINPQLGGTDDIRNLWPEPYHSPVWNADAKDHLEKRLHQMVCERQIDLEAAQRDIATDWIAAYKKYFHSEKPV